MPETIVVHKGHGLPYSKGVMAQALSATGLTPERSFELARIIERRLSERGAAEIDIETLRELAENVLDEEEGEGAVKRYRNWAALDRLDRPLVVLLGGTTGVGKSTVATMLAGRLGITRVIATDVIRQVLRAFFTREFMPSVHHSAFDAGGIDGFRDQAARVATGMAAIIDREADEGESLLVEGVHVVPGTLDPKLRARCVTVEALIVVGDEEAHQGHFSLRGAARPADRYLKSFEEIRELQEFLTARAREVKVPVIDNANVDQAILDLMDLVLDTVGTEVSE